MNELNKGQEQHQFLFQKASVGRRLGAFLIDHCIFSFIFGFVLSFGMLGAWTSDDFYEPPILFFIFVFVLIFLVYGFRDVLKGQSIGKRVLGIGVRDIYDNFAVPSTFRLFLRQVFSFIWFVEFFVLIFSSDNRKIGDKVAGTGVYNLREYEEFIQYSKRMEYINQTQNFEHLQSAKLRPHIEQYKPKKAKTAKIIIVVVLAVTIFVGALVFGITSMFRNHPAYHAAVDSIKANSEITALIGDIESFGFMPSGSIRTSPGRGDADFNIRARGAYGETRVFVGLQMRDGGNWEIVRFNFVQIR